MIFPYFIYKQSTRMKHKRSGRSLRTLAGISEIADGGISAFAVKNGICRYELLQSGLGTRFQAFEVGVFTLFILFFSVQCPLILKIQLAAKA